MPRPKKGRRDGHSNQNRMVKTIDEIRQYEEWREEILPLLQADIKKGLPPAEMIKKYRSMIAARQIMRAIKPEDDSVSAAAAKDLLDRSEGKPVEKKEIKHALEDLPEEQLDAVLLTKLADMKSKERK